MKEGRGELRGEVMRDRVLLGDQVSFIMTQQPPLTPSPLDDENRLLKRCKKFLNLRLKNRLSKFFFSFQFFPANGGRLIRWGAREEGKKSLAEKS